MTREKPLEIVVPSSRISETDTIIMPKSELDTTYNDYIEHLDAKAFVLIEYKGNDAYVIGTAPFTKDGAHVTVTTSRRTEITVLGSSENGSLTITPSVPLDKEQQYRCAVILDNVKLHNPSGAAINSQLKKRLLIHCNDNTTNTISCIAPQTGDEIPDVTLYGKGCIFSEDNIIFSGKGTLNVTSSFRNCVAADDRIVVRPNTFITLSASRGNGMKANDGVFINGGQTTIFSTGTTEYKKVPISPECPQGIDTVNCAGIKTDYSVFINHGLLQVKCEGENSKGIKADYDYIQTGGDVKIVTLGPKLIASPKALKADKDITISAGTFYAYSKFAEAIEADGTCTISPKKDDKGYMIKVGE